MNIPLAHFPDALPEQALARLFTEARSHNGWLDRPLAPDTEQRLYELLRMGPTSANCSPARFVFVRSPEGKEKLRPALSSGNLEKTMAAPLTVIVAHDPAFHEKLPELFPHTDARPWFTSTPGVAEETAFRNGTLQGAYLMLAARSLGLDCGPMSGFDKQKVADAFLAAEGWQPNFLVNIGHGDHGKLFGRLPRLDFAQCCKVV